MKNTLSIFAFSLFPFFLFSQNFSVGIFGGLNASYQVFKNESTSASLNPITSKPGYFIGASAVYKLTDFLALRGGLNMERKGGKEEYMLTDANGNPTGDASLQVNIDYFQIPLLVEASFLKDRILFVNVGYGFSFMQKAKIKSVGFPIPTNGDVTALYEKVDYAFLIGMGVKVPATKKISFTFEGRWENGLTDVVKDISIAGKNRSVFAAAGLRYQL